MDNFKSFKSLLYTLNEGNASDIALRLFRFQAKYNPVYAQYLFHLKVDPDRIRTLNEIPFLPISFFKNQTVKTTEWQHEAEFTSSGTVSQTTSTHFIADIDFYITHAEKCFKHVFGALEDYHILALMPSYLERKNSSLVAMLNAFIKKTGSAYSGFYLYDYEKLLKDIKHLQKDNKKIMLWGVSFALLDLAEKFSPDLSRCIILETGGMKGRRKEMTRNELHSQLKNYFNVNCIYSEYGMTELLSQAYTRGGDIFYPSPWMKILTRDVADPFEKGFFSSNGGLNVIDFANFHSISFIETEDAGKAYTDGSFEVTGRLDNSDVRGCNLMME